MVTFGEDKWKQYEGGMVKRILKFIVMLLFLMKNGYVLLT